MRQRLAIVLTIAVVIGLLVVLNTLNYVQATEKSDSELTPNRSTYNSGATGTRALYDLLNESGYKVMRWRESPAILLSQNRVNVSTFVVVGRTLLPFEPEQVQYLLLWVEQGGRLVIIDRHPDFRLLANSGDWTIASYLRDFPPPDIDSANADDMTEGTKPVHPAQPTLLTRDVETVRPSRFASVIEFNREKAKAKSAKAETAPPPHGSTVVIKPAETESPPPATAVPESTPRIISSPAPVVDISHAKGPLLVDYPHGAGRIIILTDPYIVANGGIGLADNLQLAINTVAGGPGIIAFDEFHQGRATSENPLVSYFAGTPILAICGQLVLIVLVILWTQGRRFGRPLPLAQVDRRSSLEFVASMAELQQRARALDLAIENIYSRTRRVLTRYAGVDYHSSRSEIAERVAARSSLNRERLEALMRMCEETINGGPVNERQSIELVKRLREVEGALGLRMRSREVRQAAEKI
jgi:hypothetical protein